MVLCSVSPHARGRQLRRWRGQAEAQLARKRRLGYFSAATNRLDSQPRGLPGLVRLFRMLRRKTSYPRFQRLDRSAYRDAQPGYLIDYYHPV